MRKTVFPERTCRASVAGEFQGHSCEIVEYHSGPCASESVPHSVKAREAWEAAHPDVPAVQAPEVWV
jgi:hypothetical protein